jgi:transcriptional regulator with XRE-family HTH domain
MDVGHRFGRNVRRQRRARDISQEDLAERAGINRTYLSALESTSSVNPTLRVMEGIANALGVTICSLLGETITHSGLGGRDSDDHSHR